MQGLDIGFGSGSNRTVPPIGITMNPTTFVTNTPTRSNNDNTPARSIFDTTSATPFFINNTTSQGHDHDVSLLFDNPDEFAPSQGHVEARPRRVIDFE
jgi:hypothetical protein